MRVTKEEETIDYYHVEKKSNLNHLYSLNTSSSWCTVF